MLLKTKSIRHVIFYLLFIFISISAASAAETVAVIYPQNNKAISFAADETKALLEDAGYVVKLEDVGNLAKVIVKNRVIITMRGTDEANSFLRQPGVSSLPSLSAEGYSFRKKTEGANTDWYIIGADKNGAIYGGQDFGRSVKMYGLDSVSEKDKRPYITNRGIKFNIPLDARTPGYSDNSDIAQENIINMWDINFWHQFLDDMARNRFNTLSLWSLAPFPSMVDVPEYKNIGINDVKKTTYPLSGFKSLNGTNMSNENVLANLVTVKKISLSDKIKFWQDVMQYASDRGIDCYIFTWNTFTYGTENSGYRFTPALRDSRTKDYFRKATKALINTYPLLKGIGITAGENLKGTDLQKEAFLYDTYGQGINDALETNPKRTFNLVHRVHQTSVKLIKSSFSRLNSRCRLNFSFKYSQAHLYSSVAPDYIKKSHFLNNIGNSHFFLTLRDDDWYYLRGGSDPAFARNFIKNIPNTNFSGFFLGPDGYTWGKDCVSKDRHSAGQLILNKRWYSFKIWGELAYDPKLSDSFFINVLKIRFPKVNAKNLFLAWSKASRVIPLVNRFHNKDCQLDYQWYPEACFSNSGFHNIYRFINVEPQTGEGMMSIPEYSDAFLNGTPMTGTTPRRVANNLDALSDEALMLVADIASADKELRHTVSDITAMAYLGQYYSRKILGATYKSISDKAIDARKKEFYKNRAILNLRSAAECWRNYASQISSAYAPQWLTRMQQTVDIKAIQEDVDKDIFRIGGSINRVAVTGVTVSPSAVNIGIRDTQQLIALVTPAIATNKNVRWSSSNPAVAIVNANGLVRGIVSGSATITATTLDGEKTATCTVNVTNSRKKEVRLLGPWVAGTSHGAESGENRALIVFIYAEDSSTMSINSVKYGGQRMKPILQKNQNSGKSSYTSAFILDETGIKAAQDTGIAITWTKAPPGGTAVISAFFSNVDQSTMVGEKASGGNNNSASVSTRSLATATGDMIIVAATAETNTSDYVVNNGFEKRLGEQSQSWGDVVAGYKRASGVAEKPMVTVPENMRQSIIGFVLIANSSTKTVRMKIDKEQVELDSVRIYPNPVFNRNLTVDFGTPVKSGLIQLFDLAGRLRKTVPINVNATTQLIDVSQLEKGVYFLNINTNKNHVFIKKLLVE